MKNEKTDNIPVDTVFEAYNDKSTDCFIKLLHQITAYLIITQVGVNFLHVHTKTAIAHVFLLGFC